MAKEKRLTQKDKIIRHLMDFGSITALDAMREYGIMQLAARIFEINAKGQYYIMSEMEEGRNRYGETVRYARYFLALKPEVANAV